MGNGTHVLERCGFMSPAGGDESSSKRGAGSSVWLIAARGWRQRVRLLWLVAVRAAKSETASERVKKFARQQGCGRSSVDALFELTPGAVNDNESDFMILYRRASATGLAAIELAAVEVKPGHSRRAAR
jgi:hypothetical protein